MSENTQVTPSKHNVQVVLDVLSAYFDLPTRIFVQDKCSKIEEVIGQAVIQKYDRFLSNWRDFSRETHNNPPKFDEELNGLINEIIQGKDIDGIEALFEEVYPLLSSNSSSLSLRLDLHCKWKIIRILTDYLIVKEYQDREKDKQKNICSYPYLHNNLFVSVKEFKSFKQSDNGENTLNKPVVLFGPFLCWEEVGKMEVDRTIEDVYGFTQLFFQKSDIDIYPSKSDFLRLGNTFLRSRKADVVKKIEKYLEAFRLVNEITVPQDYNKLGKEDWIFFSFCGIFLSRKAGFLYKKFPSSTLNFYNTYRLTSNRDIDNKCGCNRLKISVDKEGVSSLLFDPNIKECRSSVCLEIKTTNSLKERVKQKLFEYFKTDNLTPEEMAILWDEGYVEYVRKTLSNISQITNNRIAIIEEYLNSNWQKYLFHETSAYNDFCRWISLILRGGNTCIYEYNYSDDKFPIDKKYSYPTEITQGVNSQALLGNLERMNAKNKEGRCSESIIYRCLYKKNGQHVPCLGSEFGSFVKNDPQSKSAMAHSLLYKGRPLGVVELQGKESYFFRDANIYKLEQLAIFFGEYFHRINSYTNLKKIVELAGNVAKLGSQEVFNEQAKCIADLFLASAAGIWLKDKEIRGYCLKGFYGLDKLTEKLEIEPQGMFFQDDGESVGSKYLQKRMRVDRDDRLAFFMDQDYERKSSQPHAKLLASNDFDRVMLFGVEDRNSNEKEPVAIITIHNKSQQTHSFEYSKAWGEDIAEITEFISSALTIMKIREGDFRERQQQLGHDLRTYVGQLFDSSRSLQKIVSDDSDNQKKLGLIDFKLRYDLSVIAEQANSLIGDIYSNYSSKANSKDTFIKIVTSFIGRKSKPVNFRQAYNKTFENFSEVRSARKLRFEEVPGKELRGERDWLVHINPHLLHTILSNLIQNSFKYAFDNTIVEISMEEGIDELIFTMSNIGKQMKEPYYEAFKVFEYKVRGTNGIEMDGEGIGLWEVKSIMEAYGNDVHFNVFPEVGKNVCKYVVELHFYQYKEGNRKLI
jgi:signal transduction histidine kinase